VHSHGLGTAKQSHEHTTVLVTKWMQVSLLEIDESLFTAASSIAIVAANI
jgi:hypothetical protein